MNNPWNSGAKWLPCLVLATTLGVFGSPVHGDFFIQPEEDPAACRARYHSGIDQMLGATIEMYQRKVAAYRDGLVMQHAAARGLDARTWYGLDATSPTALNVGMVARAVEMTTDLMRDLASLANPAADAVNHGINMSKSSIKELYERGRINEQRLTSDFVFAIDGVRQSRGGQVAQLVITLEGYWTQVEALVDMPDAQKAMLQDIARVNRQISSHVARMEVQLAEALRASRELEAVRGQLIREANRLCGQASEHDLMRLTGGASRSSQAYQSGREDVQRMRGAEAALAQDTMMQGLDRLQAANVARVEAEQQRQEQQRQMLLEQQRARQQQMLLEQQRVQQQQNASRVEGGVCRRGGIWMPSLGRCHYGLAKGQYTPPPR